MMSHNVKSTGGLKISKKSFLRASTVVGVYLIGISLTFLFVDELGGSSLVDEAVLLLLAPLSLLGLRNIIKKVPTVTAMFLFYFFMCFLSSVFIQMYRSDIPVLAQAFGLGLDLKLFVMFGALVFFLHKDKRSYFEQIESICLVIIFIGLFNSIFFLRDIFSSGVSISGIYLSSSPIYGYIPVGLHSHKVSSALLNALALAASVAFYMNNKSKWVIFSSILFAVLLLFSSSLKETSILIVVYIIIIKNSFGHKGKEKTQSRKLFLALVIITPVLLIIFGGYFIKLVESRNVAYIQQESVRSLLYKKSVEVANDYFPLGSGPGTYSSQPSRTVHYSPLYHEYQLSKYYGASPENPHYLMDVGWPKFIAEAGWLGFLSYFLGFMYAFLSIIKSFLKRANLINTFGLLLGALVFSSSLASAVFTGNIGVLLCALFLIVFFVDRKMLQNKSLLK